MAIVTQGDTVTYTDTGTTTSTAQGVVLMTPGQTASLGSPANPLVTQTSSLQTTPDLTNLVGAISTATTTAVSTATASVRTRVYRMRINVAGAQQITVQNGAATLEVLNFPAAAVLTYDFSTRPWYTTTANTALNFVTTTTAVTNYVLEITKVA